MVSSVRRASTIDATPLLLVVRLNVTRPVRLSLDGGVATTESTWAHLGERLRHAGRPDRRLRHAQSCALDSATPSANGVPTGHRDHVDGAGESLRDALAVSSPEVGEAVTSWPLWGHLRGVRPVRDRLGRDVHDGTQLSGGAGHGGGHDAGAVTFEAVAKHDAL